MLHINEGSKRRTGHEQGRDQVKEETKLSRGLLEQVTRRAKLRDKPAGLAQGEKTSRQ